ncbi:hypothetical protein [Sphingobacterium paucimobilis]|uniref:Lipocalin-like domain-containing protein n=1 Tax=Sphingobacterium paucimobilis HER1398 TaxID=1346330 RepID=U2HRF2_9SPHI|nr:hypothetical protein [Sphingobacterium paucimobilis]ERJ58037.1 hypothetical protein M472_04595 [Sphingobacterium paucimobilis HER1398]
MKLLLTTFFLSIIGFFCHAQSIETDIIGKWKCIKLIVLDEKGQPTGKPRIPKNEGNDISYVFSANRTGKYTDEGKFDLDEFMFDSKFTDDRLIITNQQDKERTYTMTVTLDDAKKTMTMKVHPENGNTGGLLLTLVRPR